MKIYEPLIKILLFIGAVVVIVWIATMPVLLMGNMVETEQTQTEQESDYKPSEFSGFSLGPNGIVPGLGGMPIMD